MQKALPDKYRILTTKDGSPTLELTSNGVTENMHNFHGALSETDYIYGEALRKASELGMPLRVLSVGLGIGYNEILAAAHALKHGVECELDSYEIDDFLKEGFLSWLSSDDSSGALFPVYEQILELWVDHFAVDFTKLKESLKDHSITGRFRFHSEFKPEDPPKEKYSVLFYDPFSTKTNPRFWSEEALQDFLERLAGPDCVFTTYAATGALKRSLKLAGFEVSVRPGFGGKRQSFLAVKQGHPSV